MAAREAKDGSGILAVASKDVVVLHDTKRGKEQSWGLSAPQEEVRHLQYSNDAKSLFLSTASDGRIQQYSTERSRLLEPVQKHSSAPVALAISPNEQLMVSASSIPPVVYLKNLAGTTAGTLMQPNASNAPVCAAAFHAARPSIFMLAFQDATVAAYDATRVSRDAGRYTTQVAGNDGEISRLTNLHRKVITGDLSLDTFNAAAPIIGIAFIPGYKLRAVTAGRDGRCRIIDFANGGAILRTWNCRAPCTAISVLSDRGDVKSQTSRSANTEKSKQDMDDGISDSLIAVGLMDGAIQVYDAVGLMLASEKVSSREEKVISVEWINGASPQALSGAHLGQFDKEASDVVIDPMHGARSSELPMRKGPEKSTPKNERKEMSGLGLPLALRRSSAQQPQVTRQLTFHPDELAAVPKRSGPAPLPSSRHSDSVSPSRDLAGRSAYRQVSSPHSDRPRLSQQTFMKRSPASVAKAGKARPLRLNFSLPATSDASTSTSALVSGRKYLSNERSLKRDRRPNAQVPPVGSRDRHITFKPSAMDIGDATVASSEMAASVSELDNAHFLSGGRDTAADTSHREAMPGVHSSARSMSGMAKHGRKEDDVWLTSDDDDDDDDNEMAPRQQPKRSPEDVTSERKASMVLGVQKENSPSPASHFEPACRAEETEISTAQGALLPMAAQSEGVRELFPRSSSLSPLMKKRRYPNKPFHRRNSLRDGHEPIAASPLSAPDPAVVSKSPWARARAQAVKASPLNSRPVRKNEFVTVLGSEDGTMDTCMRTRLVRSASFTCLECPETRARVLVLEREVEGLKQELSALKNTVVGRRVGPSLFRRKCG